LGGRARTRAFPKARTQKRENAKMNAEGKIEKRGGIVLGKPRHAGASIGQRHKPLKGGPRKGGIGALTTPKPYVKHVSLRREKRRSAGPETKKGKGKRLRLKGLGGAFTPRQG